MGTSMVRQFDSAAGIVVLLLLVVAVVGGQSTMGSISETASGINVSTTYRFSGPGSSSIAGQASEPSRRAVIAEPMFPVTDFIQDLRLRDIDDDRPVLLDD